MSRYTTDLINKIAPYVPGEQPRDKRYVKLNTNENPYYASPKAVERISRQAVMNMNRYSDPESTQLIKAIADFYGVNTDNVMVTNGSDEALAFCFIAYGTKGVCYPDVTYGFYDVIANLFGCSIKHIDLESDFTIDAKKYYNAGRTVVIANPNAQTGIALPLCDIEKIVANNPNDIVIIDQAYADFSGENAVGLIGKYNNLVVVNTFSKSRSLAGARVGFVIADKALIEDIKKVKNSFHPYNVNSLSAALAAEAIADKEYFEYTVAKVIEGRKNLTDRLRELNFEVLQSSANFVLARHNKMGGQRLYELLKEKGVLVRHFNDKRIADYVRITIGTDEEINTLIDTIKQILSENNL